MGIDDFSEEVDITRKVWENKNGSKITSVTSILSVGEYELDYTKENDGTVIIEYTPKDVSD